MDAPLPEAEVASQRRRRPSPALLAPVIVLLLYGAWRYLGDALAPPGVDAITSLSVLPPLIIGILHLVAIPSLLVGSRFGWVLAVSMAAWALTYLLVRWSNGFEPYPLMALTAVMTLLLHSPEMRAAYRFEPAED